VINKIAGDQRLGKDKRDVKMMRKLPSTPFRQCPTKGEDSKAGSQPVDSFVPPILSRNRFDQVPVEVFEQAFHQSAGYWISRNSL
jgi:hypothetical protein